MKFPFQLDQPMVNGKRFFEFIVHYKLKIAEIKQGFKNNEIIRLLNNYAGRSRTGDKFVRTLFDCCLLFYIDKFGHAEIDRAIEKFFIWCYKLRVEHYSVQLATIDNHALTTPHLFKIIRDATHPKEILSVPINAPSRILDNSKTVDIV